MFFDFVRRLRLDRFQKICHHGSCGTFFWTVQYLSLFCEAEPASLWRANQSCAQFPSVPKMTFSDEEWHWWLRSWISSNWLWLYFSRSHLDFHSRRASLHLQEQYLLWGRRATDTEPMDRILPWAVQLQGQWRSISTELSLDRHRGWPPHPSQRSGGCSTITEEREVSWSR